MENGQQIVVFESGGVMKVWIFRGSHFIRELEGVPRGASLSDGTLVEFLGKQAAKYGLLVVPSNVPHEFDLKWKKPLRSVFESRHHL